VTLDEVLERVRATVSYLRASTATPADEDWIGCGSLIADPAHLSQLVTATGDGRGAHDEQVAASLFVQGYAFRVAGVALAAYALGLPVPTTRPDATAIRIARHRPSALAVLDATLGPPDAPAVADAILDGHLAPLVAAVRGVARVGERLLWGNVATSCAVAFRAVEGETHDPAVRQRAEAWFAAAGPRLDGLGGFTTLVHAGRDGWYWDRTNCCLWYRTADGRLCDDCSLEPEAERLARRRLELEAAP
jgi:iron complex transport system ATP-binding protein